MSQRITHPSFIHGRSKIIPSSFAIVFWPLAELGRVYFGRGVSLQGRVCDALEPRRKFREASRNVLPQRAPPSNLFWPGRWRWQNPMHPNDAFLRARRPRQQGPPGRRDASPQRREGELLLPVTLHVVLFTISTHKRSILSVL